MLKLVPRLREPVKMHATRPQQAARRLLRRIQRVAQPYALKTPRVVSDPRGWLRLEFLGRPKRRLAGGRTDLRPRLFTAATDGALLQLAYRLCGALKDSRLLHANAGELPVCDAFTARSATVQKETSRPKPQPDGQRRRQPRSPRS
jgi:hypothetical protein